MESKQLEKKKAQKVLRKQRDKEHKEEIKKQELEEEEKKRFASLSDREKVSWRGFNSWNPRVLSNLIMSIVYFYYRELWPPRRG